MGALAGSVVGTCGWYVATNGDERRRPRPGAAVEATAALTRALAAALSSTPPEADDTNRRAAASQASWSWSHAVASVLGDLTSNSGRAASLAAHGPLLDWLLAHAAEQGPAVPGDGSAAAARALGHLISTPEGATAIMARPRSVARLLVAASCETRREDGALTLCEASAAVARDAASRLPWDSAAESRRIASYANDEATAIVDALTDAGGAAPLAAAVLAERFRRAAGGGGDATSTRIARAALTDARLTPALSTLVSGGSSDPSAFDARTPAAQAMAHAARILTEFGDGVQESAGAPAIFVGPLLLMAADAHVVGDPTAINTSLHALARVVRLGGPSAAEAAQRNNAAAVLRHLSDGVKIGSSSAPTTTLVSTSQLDVFDEFATGTQKKRPALTERLRRSLSRDNGSSKVSTPPPSRHPPPSQHEGASVPTPPLRIMLERRAALASAAASLAAAPGALTPSDALGWVVPTLVRWIREESVRAARDVNSLDVATRDAHNSALSFCRYGLEALCAPPHAGVVRSCAAMAWLAGLTEEVCGVYVASSSPQSAAAVEASGNGESKTLELLLAPERSSALKGLSTALKLSDEARRMAAESLTTSPGAPVRMLSRWRSSIGASSGGANASAEIKSAKTSSAANDAQMDAEPEQPPRSVMEQAAGHFALALKLTSRVAASDDAASTYLRHGGALALLSSLARMDVENDAAIAAPPADDPVGVAAIAEVKERPSLLLTSLESRRQAARLCAVLLAHPFGAPSLDAAPRLRRWLAESVVAQEDSKLASHAKRALLNAEAWDGRVHVTPRPTYRDGLHLLDARAPHFDALAWHSRSDNKHSSRPPDADVVFVHGLRGGGFSTWRIGSSPRRYQEAKDLWPLWLNRPDIGVRADASSLTSSAQICSLPPHGGGLRLLSASYYAPVSAWSGDSLPLDLVAARLLRALHDAQVGADGRPVIFVAHSMGGIVIKQMLSIGMLEGSMSAEDAALGARRRPQPSDTTDTTPTKSEVWSGDAAGIYAALLRDRACGVAFYSTPHFGSWLADVGVLARPVLRPSMLVSKIRERRKERYEADLNECLRNLHGSDGAPLGVLSFSEGKRMPLVEVWPSAGISLKGIVVAEESAYPGFGHLVTLSDVDHQRVCKPCAPSDLSYAELRAAMRSWLDSSFEVRASARL